MYDNWSNHAEAVSELIEHYKECSPGTVGVRVSAKRGVRENHL